MLRRFLALLAAVLLCATLGGCALLGAQPPSAPTGDTPTADYTTEFQDRWCYRTLSSRLQAMYAALYTAVRECESDTHISIRGGDGADTEYIGLKVQLPTPMNDSADARVLFNAFTTDNPQFFFLGNTYSYEGYRLEGKEYYDVFVLTLTMEQDERAAAAALLEQEVTALLAACPSEASDYEVELFLHDQLAARVTYDRDTAASETPAAVRPSAFTAHGALVEGHAVCEGYSRAMQLLLQRAGIACTLVSGMAGGEAHMWNLAEIDGRNYHLDVTWDDADDRLHHTYLNLNTAQLLLSHQPDEGNLGVDTCTATEANYYVKEKRYLDTFDRSLIAEEVARQFSTGADVIDLKFSPDTFANAQLFFSNSRRVKQYVAPFLQEALLWNYTCQANDTHHTLTLYKEE